MTDTTDFSIRAETGNMLAENERLFWPGIYIATIVTSNLLMVWLPMIEVLGTMIPPAIILFGFVFVLRDFAQRVLGHYVLVPMAVAAVLTFLLAGPAIAGASLTAFLISEIVDWVIFSRLNRPFSQRVALSSFLGVLADTFVFFAVLGILEPHSFVVGCAVKLVWTLLFWAVLAWHERSAS